ncbi:MAG TPA: histidinol dehydrogenase [Gammaproteobacteria bacterium]|nr:histidinol dehydrogenase [Gammaproteobacteria bacterium]|tara:strand:- start:2555 stop:3874 length:1320 start_codon:yes stop_codon:yes gene_type:complete
MPEQAITRLDTKESDFASRLDALLHWDMSVDSQLHERVAAIIQAVREEGDAALLRFTAEFDRNPAADVAALTLGAERMRAAWEQLSEADKQVLVTARDRIRTFHEHQLESTWSFTDDLDNELGQLVTPLERVGVYVPGGQAAYPSSVLMTLIPAKVAGVDELIVTVPTPGGEVNMMVLAALHLAQPDLVLSIGGAQAVAALAYGTASVPRVDKIVGPGGAYVATAKKQVFGQVGIDMIAGPSEVLILADGTTPVEWAVLDLFSQAEHDASAQSILVSPDSAFLDRVAADIAKRLATMERAPIIRESLARRGALIHCRDLTEGADIVNRIAPEHLELALADVAAWLPKIRHAGAIFCGPYTGETFADYMAGPSHVLPTFGTARFASPLGVYDFQKRSSLVTFSQTGAQALAHSTEMLARKEGLQAHAEAARVRGGNTDSE